MRNPPDPCATAAALLSAGLGHLDAGRPAEAIAAMVESLRLAPENAAGYIALANVLGQFGLPAEARIMADAAVALAPNDVQAIFCLAGLQTASAQFADAAELYRRLLAKHPGHAGALTSLANCLMALGREDEALALHARAVTGAPLDADAHYNRADALLATGDYATGWQEYEWRWLRRHAEPRRQGPAWDGAALDGQTILLYAEQGFGDTLQFARYAPLVAARGGRVVLEVQPALLRLMGTLPGVAERVAQGSACARYDTHCALMSLPRVFGTRLVTVPATIPYLHADPAAAAAWQQALPPAPLRVGLTWAGSAHATAAGLQVYDQRRSLPLAAFAPLAEVPGVQFVSLQTGPPARQLQTPPAGLRILDGMAAAKDFADTAALVDRLDLVISVDTAVAHLAGAMGRPVWLLSRLDGCWRWLRRREDSPWYPTLRIYRQTDPLCWDGVIARIAQDLAALQAVRVALPGAESSISRDARLVPAPPGCEASQKPGGRSAA